MVSLHDSNSETGHLTKDTESILLVTQFLPKKKTVFFFILQVPGIIKLNSSLADSQPQYDYLLAIHAKITNNFIDLETQMNTQINQ